MLGCPVKCEKSVVMACAPKRILPKVPVTEDLLAHVILSKFDDRQPLYHLEKQFASRHGINISRQDLSRWVVDAAKRLIPLLDERLATDGKAGSTKEELSIAMDGRL